ncbi:MAG: zf-HC2 domain-containing protein [bacterium]|nr:zf-HC2 domain-containing protein [bacterium]
MRCNEIQALLAKRFDQGEELAAGLEAHLTGCAPCRRYASDLAALATGIRELPRPSPSPGLAAAIRHSTGSGATDTSAAWTRPGAVLLVALTTGAVVVVGWLYPVPLRLAAVWETLNGLLGLVDMAQARALLWAPLSLASEQASRLAGRAPDIPQSLLWTLLTALVAFTVVYNGISASVTKHGHNQDRTGEGVDPLSPSH